MKVSGLVGVTTLYSSTESWLQRFIIYGSQELNVYADHNSGTGNLSPNSFGGSRVKVTKGKRFGWPRYKYGFAVL